MFYGLRRWMPKTSAGSSPRSTASCVHKWWFDELYALAVGPAGAADLAVGWPQFDQQGIDCLADGTARAGGRLSPGWTIGSIACFVDGLVNLTARVDLRASGLRLRAVQTGNVRQYVMWLAARHRGRCSCWSVLFWNFCDLANVNDYAMLINPECVLFEPDHLPAGAGSAGAVLPAQAAGARRSSSSRS